ncbi:MAG: hypothetical protein IPN42_09315 [Methylococcaceae bacterium]|nr:hypothetical protein [Methylococcaceae bacterium]
MLEISLSMVAAFAAYTFYAIVGDEIAANRSSKQVSYKNITKAEEAPSVNRSTIPTPKSTSKPKTNTRKPKAKLTEKAATTPDPVAIASDAILAYLSANGSITINKLIKEIPSDKESVVLAVEKLISNKSAISLKRGGHPAIGPIAS